LGRFDRQASIWLGKRKRTKHARSTELDNPHPLEKMQGMAILHTKTNLPIVQIVPRVPYVHDGLATVILSAAKDLAWLRFGDRSLRAR
jgi:hypothetical protein